MTVEALLATYGYAALFIGAVVEGETFLIAGAVLAAEKMLSLPGVLAAAFCGAVCGDHFFFYLGKCRGRRLLRRCPELGRRIARAARLLERYQRLVVPGFRFCYGLRAATPMVLGMGGYPPERFLLFDLLGAAVWTAAVAAAGMGLRTLLTRMADGAVLAAAGMGAAALIAWILVLAGRRQRRLKTAAKDR